MGKENKESKLNKIVVDAEKTAGDAIQKAKDAVISVVDQNDDGEFNLKDVTAIAEQLSEKHEMIRQQAERRQLKPIFVDDLDRQEFLMPKLVRIVDIDKKHKDNMISWNNLYTYIENAVNLAQDFLDRHHNHVYLYGGGGACPYYLSFLYAHGITVEGIIESDPSKWAKQDGKAHGLPVLSLQDAISGKEENDYSIIIGAPKFLNEIKRHLTENCPAENIFSFEGEIYSYFIRYKGY